MTDITVSAANVRPLPGCIIRRFTAGAAIDVGAPVYMSAADTVVEAEGGTAAKAAVVGLAVATAPTAASTTAAASGEEVDVVLWGPVAGMTSMVYGTYYYVKDTAGVITDTAGTKDCLIGIGLNTEVLLVRPQPIDLT